MGRREILQSRVASTEAIGQAIARAKMPPPTWLQSSTATIYAHRFDAGNDETTGLGGGDEPGVPETWRFSIEVAKAWERAATVSAMPATRLVRFGLGGQSGDGRQYVSWIHERDFLRAIDWLIASDMTGPVNVAAPEPLPNADFMRAIREAWGARLGLPATRWMLEIGAVFLRTETELILKSRRVVPGRLVAGSFRFDFPTWPAAARDLCKRWRDLQAG